jgi:hypothetical protein
VSEAAKLYIFINSSFRAFCFSTFIEASA